MIRLIGLDVDGTLLDARGQMPQANVDAIHEAVAAGVHVALVTGRSYPFVRPLADRLLGERRVQRHRSWYQGEWGSYRALTEQLEAECVVELGKVWALVGEPGGLERRRFLEQLPEIDLDYPEKAVPIRLRAP